MMLTKPLRTRMANCILSGTIMSVCAVLLWFLLSSSTKRLGVMILSSLLVLIIIDYFCFQIIKQRGKLQKICIRCAFVVINAVVLISVTVYSIAPSLLFYPNHDEEAYNSLKTMDNIEELKIESDNQILYGWMLHNNEGQAPLVLYFGGNGENSSKRMLRILENDMQKTIFKGYNIAILDYPGYGKSSGSPSEESLKSMGLEAYDALVERSDVYTKKVVILGYSIGTGVANYVASQRDVAGLMLMAPYADGFDLYNGMMDIFHGPFRLLVGFRMESVRYAEDVAVVPLIMASESDEMVNYESSLRLSKAYPDGCQLKTLNGIGHNDLWGSETVQEQISEYLREVQNGK